MRHQAIVLRRISSKDQESGHSLDAQLKNVQMKADQLGVEIVKEWSGVLSSRKGKNFGRKDLEEMLAYCKSNKQVKYVLVDMVNRLMREMKVMIYYIVMFEQLGVKIVFCDPSQEHLNRDGHMSQLMLALEGFKSEADNDSRIETSMSRMHSRIKDGYYLSHPHQGYVTSGTPGLHVPDPLRFKPLKDACRHIIYDGYTVNEAVKWLNDNGYRTRGGKKMATDHFIELLSDRYYCGYIDIKSEGWPKDIKGLHEHMLTVREHAQLVAIMTKRNPRLRMKHNPDFPMANILRHEECVGAGGYEKFAGVNFNPGKRPSGRQRRIRQVYDCRDCRQRLPKDKVHEHFAEHLSQLKFLPDDAKFKQALLRVWRMQRGSVAERIRVLRTKKSGIEQKMRETTTSYAAETEGPIKDSLRKLLEEYSQEIKEVDADILTTQNIELESEDFVEFAMDFASSMSDKWWKLSYENRKRGEQILFNGKIYADNSATIRTPQLSSIYRLGTNKKALENASKAHLEELAVIATASVSLSS